MLKQFLFKPSSTAATSSEIAQLRLKIHIEYTEALNWSFLRAGIPLIWTMKIENLRAEKTSPVWLRLVVDKYLDTGFMVPPIAGYSAITVFDEAPQRPQQTNPPKPVGPRQTEWPWKYEKAMKIPKSHPAELQIFVGALKQNLALQILGPSEWDPTVIAESGRLVLRETAKLRIVTFQFKSEPTVSAEWRRWTGPSELQAAISALIFPDHPKADEIKCEAVRSLGRALDQSLASSVERQQVASSVYSEVLRALKDPYKDIEDFSIGETQRLRFPNRIVGKIRKGAGTCLDFAAFLLAPLEASGLTVVFVLLATEESLCHAVVGVWLSPRERDARILKDAAMLRGAVMSGECIVIDVDSLAGLQNFTLAVESGKQLVLGNDLCYAVNLEVIRNAEPYVRPLPWPGPSLADVIIELGQTLADSMPWLVAALIVVGSLAAALYLKLHRVDVSESHFEVRAFEPETDPGIRGHMAFELHEYLSARLDEIQLEGASIVVVTGTVELAGGNDPRVNLLVESAGRTLYKGGTDVKTYDIYDVEETVYESIVRSVSGRLKTSPIISPPCASSDATARRLYWDGRDVMHDAASDDYLDKAIDLYNRALEKDSQFACADAALADALLTKARQTSDPHLLQHALEAAQAGYSKVANGKCPVAVYFALGSALGAKGQTQLAVAEISEGLKLEPKNDEGFRRLGRVFQDGNKKKDALRNFKRAVELRPDKWQNSFQLANFYFETGELDGALNAFKDVQRARRPEGPVGEGLVYLGRAEFSKATQQFRGALLLKEDGIVYSNLGTALFFDHDFRNAQEAFQQAYAKLPKNDVIVGNLADCLRQAGSIEDADKYYGEAIALVKGQLATGPEDPGRLGNLAVYEAKIGDFEKAFVDLKRAEKLQSGSADLMYDKATIYVLHKQYDDAIGTLGKVVKLGVPMKQIEADPEFDIIRSMSGFQEINRRLK